MAGNDKGSRRRFGSVRQLASGKWQARYTAPDGLPRKAPRPLDTKRAAERWLVETEAEILRGDWLDPDAGKITLTEFAARWVRERDLKARTREEYERHLRLHVTPYLGNRELTSIAGPHIRTWWAERLDAGVGKSTVAKTYRILHAIFSTAVDDDLLRRNPCRVKGAGQDKADDRPPRCLRYSLSPMPSSPAIAFSSCSLPSRNCGSGNSSHFAATASTLTRWKCGFDAPPPKWKMAPRSTMIRSLRLASDRFAYQRRSAPTSRPI